MSKFEILKKEEFVPNFYKLDISVPTIARKAKAGQFILVMVDERSEKIPLTLIDWDKEKGTISFIVQELGLSTSKMAFMEEGDSFYSIVGPLGEPAYLENFGTVVVSGGCYGVGATYPIAKRLKELGNHVITIIEAKNENLLYYEEEFKTVSDEVILVTTDGSKGERGHIYDVLEHMIESQQRKIDHIKVIGCNVMMSKVSKLTKEKGAIPTYATVTTIMVDGTGMCGSCRLSYDGKTKFACVDGPEFNAHKIDWEEIIHVRNTLYISEETLSLQNFSPECRSLAKYQEKSREEETS
ncbi:ferredoxin-NADP reductase [Candidatus Heimdallarchaeota archaeon B3_Heim]|nr:MAG: ferredoxin-NADP reductase [Candidatus Heimdallarchaeota archaeon B3_Heim]